MAEVEVRVLGRPLVTVQGVVAPLTGRQLLLAARLALAHPASVPRPRLLTDVWPDERASDGAVRVALTRLRAALGDDVICRVDGGYTMCAPPVVDATRFERLLRADSAGDDPNGRLATIDEALGLWYGTPFEGMDSHERLPWFEAEAIRLDELREQAVDERYSLLLRTEDSSRIIADLRSELGRDPTRESRAELLARALYRAGRQADALAAIERTRAVLRDRLGLAPGPALRDLELRILRQDDALLEPTSEVCAHDSVGIDSRLHTAAALTKLGAYDEAHAILDSTIVDARQQRDRPALTRSLLAAAQTSLVSGLADPHPMIDEARQIARQLGDGQLLARCALVRFGSGTPTDKTQALVDLMEPLDLLPATAREQIDLLCAAAVLVLFIDASDAADRLLAAAERLHAEAPTERSEIVSLTARSIVGSVRRADPELVDGWAAAALELARASGQPELVVVSIQARLRALYTAGHLDAVERLLDELGAAARESALPFGIVRVTLCKATNALARGELTGMPEFIESSRSEGRRLRTFAAEGAALAQQVMLLLELDERDEVCRLARPLAARSEVNSWHALLALCGDTDADGRLLDVARHVQVEDDTFAVFTALAAEVAARTNDGELGRWCLDRLEPRGDTTIVLGLGTIVMGFAKHFAGLARLAIGDLDRAAADLEHAGWMATANDAGLWRAHSTVELADVLARTDRPADRERAAALVAGLRAGVPSSPRLLRRCDEVAELAIVPVTLRHP